MVIGLLHAQRTPSLDFIMWGTLVYGSLIGELSGSQPTWGTMATTCIPGLWIGECHQEWAGGYHDHQIKRCDRQTVPRRRKTDLKSGQTELA